jgi:hypothetical protein
MPFYTENEVDKMHSDFDALRRKVAELESLLAIYGNHRPDCPGLPTDQGFGGIYAADGPCECGWDAVKPGQIDATAKDTEALA